MGGGIGTVILVVLYLLLGGDPQALFNSQQAQLPQSAQVDNQAPRDEASKFVAVVLADTEDAWKEVFRQMGREYQEPRLVLFTDMIQSGCGFASGATGPFYCPQDRRVYIDLGFFRQLQERLGAGGDFAEAYVIAHEVGHHVQNLLGISDRVQAVRGRVSQSMRAASAVGDDRLQSRSRGYVVPDSFTHGTSEQRARWFRRGYETGDLKQGDTFNTREL